MGFLWKRVSGISRGGIAGLFAILLLGGLAVFAWGARWVNTTPAQCATCHPELTAMWKGSHGHPADKATCHECHSEHVQAPTGPNLAAYARDVAIPEKYLATDVRIEARCEGCHRQIRSADKESRPVIKVNHKIHLAALAVAGQSVRLGCLSCHRSIAHDKAQVETNRPKMSGCFAGQCHVKDRTKDSCLRCHYQKLVEPGQEAL